MKPLSFSRIRPRKSSADASWTKGIAFSMEPEPSTTRPIVSGSFSATSKPVTSCGLPVLLDLEVVLGEAGHEMVALVDRGDVELDDVDAHALHRRVRALEHPEVVGFLAVLADGRRAQVVASEYSAIGIVIS